MPDTRTDPGNRGVAELEREVDHERSQLSATIDALQAKASMGNIVDEVMKVVRDNGGDMGRNLGRTLRDNPLPALLTGVGLAWLMMGSGRQAEPWDEDEVFRRRDDRDRVSPFDGRYAGSGYDAAGDRYDLAGSLGADRPYYTGTPDDGEDGPGLRERATETISDLGARASAAVGDVGARASTIAHAAGERISEAGHAVRDAGDAARHGLSRARRRVAHAGSGTQQTIDSLMTEQPLVLGALALAVGAAIGGALPRSRTEDRMFGARAERTRQALRQMVSEEAPKLKATAGAVVAEVAAVVDETSAEVAGALPQGQAIADAAAGRVRDVASRIRDAATGEAERQNLGSSLTTKDDEGSRSPQAGEGSLSKKTGEADDRNTGQPAGAPGRPPYGV